MQIKSSKELLQFYKAIVAGHEGEWQRWEITGLCHNLRSWYTWAYNVQVPLDDLEDEMHKQFIAAGRKEIRFPFNRNETSYNNQANKRTMYSPRTARMKFVMARIQDGAK